MRAPLPALTLAVVAVAACGGPHPAPPAPPTAPGTRPPGAAATRAHRPASAGQSTARTAPPRHHPAQLCPVPPPANGPLTDQGETIGGSSATLTDGGGLLYCLTVPAVTRRGGDVVVTVQVVSRRVRAVPMDSDLAVSVSLAYGPGGTVAGRDYDVGEAIRGVLPPGGSLTGAYGFVVPAGERRVVATAGPAGAPSGWAGTV
jgi:hypothetical protein